MKHIPKKERITEAVLFRTLAVSAASILLCLAGLTGTTWAWFTLEIRSGPNTIQCADYSARASVTDASSQELPLDSPLAPGTYTVTLTLNGPAGKPGCCLLTVKTGQETTVWYTDSMTTSSSVTFSLSLSQSAEIVACASWGTPPEDNRIPAQGLMIPAPASQPGGNQQEP